MEGLFFSQINCVPVLEFTSPAKLLITGATEYGLLQGQRLMRWLRND